jgi:hypothetical protein
MVLEVNDVCEYTPEWNGNKSQDDPILIKYKNPTMQLYKNLVPQPQLVLKVGADGKADGGETTVTINNEKIVGDMISSIENLNIKLKNGTIIPVKTGKELYGADVPQIVSGLIDEVGSYLQGILTRKAAVDAKNSE